VTQNHGLNYWFKQHLWPVDTHEHLFLARAVNEVGKALFGDDWTGTEPLSPFFRLLPVLPPKEGHWSAAEIYQTLCEKRPDLNLTPPEQLPLRAHPLMRGAKVGEVPPFSAEQWLAAREVYSARVREAAPAHERFAAACGTIRSRCATGEIISALRNRRGGQICAAPAHVWNTEGATLALRFECFMLNLRDPFSNGVSDKSQWIFLERRSLERAIATMSFPPASCMPYSTGGAGRRTSRHIIRMELERRFTEGDLPQSYRAACQELSDWLGKIHPEAAPTTRKTIENDPDLRARYREMRETLSRNSPGEHPKTPREVS
jgi:hypothetical protein